MKTNRLIICIALIFMITSCSVFSKQYGISTLVGRNGSFQREIKMEATFSDSIPDLFPYDLSTGWIITQIDTIENQDHNPQIYKEVTISKKFKSMNESTSSTHMTFPTPKESMKKRFRWFYTYYIYTAVYPQVIYKGNVPMENYLNKTEQQFFLQGDMSAYRGMNGWELKELLDDMESRFMEWFIRTMYEENYKVITHFAEADYRIELPAVKDSVYFNNRAKMDGIPPEMRDVCKMLDNYLHTDYYSKLYVTKRDEMDQCVLDEQKVVTEELMEYHIQYKLILPGRIITSNTDLQKDGALEWNVNLLRFLTDDFMLTAESRIVHVWAFVVALGLILFSGYCFRKYTSSW